MVSHHEVVRDTTEFGLRRLVGVIAVILPAIALTGVLANLRDYPQPAVAVAVWLAVFAAAAWLVPRTGTGGLSRGEAAAAVLIAVAGVAAVGWDHRAHYARGNVNLAILGTVWLLGLVALSRPARAWIPAAAAVFGVHAALVVRAVGANARSLAQLEAAGYILVSLLIVFAAMRPTLGMHAAVTARRARLASRSAAERAASAAVLADRRSRRALLEMEVLPLLRGIADGTLDPAAGDVPVRCARHAAALRHFLTDRAPAAGELVAALEPALQAAAARGVLVKVQVIGDPGAPPPQVARALLAAVGAVLGALAPHQVMLTILACGEDVEVYLTFSEPLRGPVPGLAGCGRDVPPAARWHAGMTTEGTGAGCLEISWRKAVAVDRRH